MNKIFLPILLLSFLLFVSVQDIHAQINIRGVEANVNYNHAASSGNDMGGVIAGVDLNIRLKIHHAELPDALDFYAGLHRRSIFWQNDLFVVNKLENGNQEIMNFGSTSSFDFSFENVYSPMMLSLGSAYTLSLGKRLGWTNDVFLLFSPIPWSVVPYITQTYGDSNVPFRKSHHRFKFNGFLPGVGLNSCLWWKLSVREKSSFRIGLNLGYEYQDWLYPYRNFEINGKKPLSDLSSSLKHIGHIGLNFSLEFD